MSLKKAAPLKKVMMVAALAVSATLAACATPTPYQPKVTSGAVTGGFSEQKLESDRYRISFAGNSLTSRETVERYLLYRSAEVTVQNGYDWFETADHRTDRTSRSYVEPDPFARPGFGWGPYGYWRPAWRYYGPAFGWRTWDPFWGDPFFADRAQVRTVEKFEAGAEILLHKGKKPEGDPRAYDAREIMANLASSIQRPVAGK